MKEEDFYKVTDYLKEFEEKKRWFSNKDIQQFKSLPELKKALDEVQVGELSDNRKQKDFHKDLKKKELEADVFYEDPKWIVYIPKTYEASCKLSTGSEWCTGISSKGDDYHYKWYTEQGPLYIILNKQDPEEMYQLHFETDSYMDKYDDAIDDIDEFFSSLPKELGDKFRDLFIKKFWDNLTPEDVGDKLTHTLRKYFSDYIEASSNYSGRAYLDGDQVNKLIEDPYETLYYYGEDLDIQSFDPKNLKQTTAAIRDHLRDLGIRNPEETFAKIVDNFYNGQRDFNVTPWMDQIHDAVLYAARDAWIAGCMQSVLDDVEKALIDCFPEWVRPHIKVNLNEQELSLTLNEDEWKKFITEARQDVINTNYNYEEPDDLSALMGYYIVTGLKVKEPYSGWDGWSQKDYLEQLELQLEEAVDEREQLVGHQMDLFRDYDEDGNPIK